MNNHRTSKKPAPPGTGVPDANILHCIQCGWLVLRNGDEVWKWHDSRKRYQKLKAQEHYKAGRFFYVLRFGNYQRKIFRNRLFWMLHHRECIPEGQTIDHKDHNRLNDHPDNLQLRDFMENSLDNWDLATLDHVLDFFESKIQG